MGAFAALLIALGIVAVIYGLIMRSKSGRISKTPLVTTGDAASRGDSVATPKGVLSVQGSVQCPQVLTAPASGTPCLYYQLEVVGTWKVGDQTKRHTYVSEKVAAPFMIDDGSGPVPIDASKGGDFDMQKSFNDTKKEGMFDDLKSAVGKGAPMMFGGYAFQNPIGSKANKFTCTEKILPVPENLFALGKHAQGVITAPGFRSLMLSGQTREQLMGSSAKNAKMAFIGGAAAAGVGLVVGVVSALIG